MLWVRKLGSVRHKPVKAHHDPDLAQAPFLAET